MDLKTFKAEMEALLKDITEKLPAKIKADLKSKHPMDKKRAEEFKLYYGSLDAPINLSYWVMQKGGWVRPKYLAGYIGDKARKINFFIFAYNSKTRKFTIHTVHTRITGMGSESESFAIASCKAFSEKHKDMVGDFLISGPGEIDPWDLVN